MLQSEVTSPGIAIAPDAAASTQTLTASRLASARAQATADLATTTVPQRRPVAPATEVSISLLNRVLTPDDDREVDGGTRRMSAVQVVADALDVEATLPPGIDKSAVYSATAPAPQPVADRTEQHLLPPPDVIAPRSYAPELPMATLVAVRAPRSYDGVRAAPVMHPPPRPRLWAWWIVAGAGVIVVAIVTMVALSRL
jgi:hypothetical protein